MQNLTSEIELKYKRLLEQHYTYYSASEKLLELHISVKQEAQSLYDTYFDSIPIISETTTAKLLQLTETIGTHVGTARPLGLSIN